MSKVKDFFRLIRFTNIIFIALTQILFQYCVIRPMLHSAGVSPTLNTLYFSLLSFSTALVAAAGYIINDYFDEKIDAINKPEKVYIEKSIRRRVAMVMHFTFTGLAALIGLFLAIKTHNYKMALVNPLVAGLLWFYSTNYKRQILIGNIVVSFLCALVIIVPVLYESNLFAFTSEPLRHASKQIFILMFYYVLFAFLMSFIREVVKDMEDVQGDEQYNCRTLPVVAGIRFTKKFALLLGIISLFLMIMTEANSLKHDERLSFTYILFLIIIPMLYFLYSLYKADLQKDFHRLSTLIKLIIFIGILSMCVFPFSSLLS